MPGKDKRTHKFSKPSRAPFSQGDTVYFNCDIHRADPMTVVEVIGRYTHVVSTDGVDISYRTDWMSL